MPDLTTWLIEQGVSEDILMVLVFIAVLATLTTFSRYVTGIKTFGIYASMVLAFAYYYMGFVQAFTITIIVVLSTWIIRNILKTIRLHYLSRLAIVYCGNVLMILLFIVLTSFLPGDNRYLDFTHVTPLALVLIITVTDRFIASYVKKDFATAARLIGETLLISVIGWALMRWDVTREFFVNNLWIILVLIITNILVGQYTGFRWTEFIRFNQVIRNAEPSENNTEE